MKSMRLVRRLSALAFAALVALAAATPLEALACGSVSVCPMMKAMAKGAGRASCHAARGAAAAGMSTPMSCCRTEPGTPVAPAVPFAAPAATLTPLAVEVAVAGLVATAAPEAPRADHAALGLYTLHAVWRI